MSPWLLLLVPVLGWLLIRCIAPRDSVRPSEARGFMRVLEWVNKLYAAVFHGLESEEPMAMPRSGPAMLISNHTCGIDHTLLQASNPRVLGFVIAQDWYDHPSVHWLCKLTGCIPVKRDGRDISAIRLAIKVLGEGRVLPIFPEGRIVPTSGRQLAEPQPGAAFIALRSGAPVIPAYISGTPATDDVFLGSRTISRARVIYGPQVPLADLAGRTDREAIAEATRRMMDAISALRHRIHPEWDREPTWYPTTPDPPRPQRPTASADPTHEPSDPAASAGSPVAQALQPLS